MEEERIYKTLVCFRASYEQGIWIDAEITIDWTEIQNIVPSLTDLEAMAETTRKKREIREMIPREYSEFVLAAKSMFLRGRFNYDIRGPYLIDCAHKPTDEELIAWAEVNVYKTDKPAKEFR
jgi:hypothetical protein